MRRQHNILIGERTAEQIKIEVGAAIDNLENPPNDYAVRGRDLMTGIPKEIHVSYKEIAHSLDKSISKIEEAILSALEMTPPWLIHQDLIKFLETHCGSKEFIISLTSDHGAGTSPVEIERKRLKGGNFVSREIFPELNSQLELKFGVPNILARYSNMQFYINHQKLDSLNISKKEVFEEARNWLKKQSSVDEVYSLNTLSNSIGTLKIKSLINGIYPNRSGDIFLTLKPGYIEWSTKTGTTHGTHYNYDSHVPLLFYGHNIQPKQIYRNIKIIDIAPTLSILLRSAFPNACTGNPISEVFQN